MDKLFPEMFEKPDSQAIGAGLAYIVAGFLILPFFLTIFGLALFPTEYSQSWLEVAFHGLSFFICIRAFQDHLTECWNNLRGKKTSFVLTTALGILACCVLWIGYALFTPYDGMGLFAMFYSLPIVEKNLVIYPLTILAEIPIPGLLCASVLTPVAVSCLYYGTAFAPACYTKPWLGYVLVTLLIALPRLLGCLIFRWDNAMELYTLAAQMPMHWVCCYCYERTDNIWSPILIHGVTNLLGSGIVIIFLILLG